MSRRMSYSPHATCNAHYHTLVNTPHNTSLSYTYSMRTLSTSSNHYALNTIYSMYFDFTYSYLFLKII